MAALYPTPTRMILLADVAEGRVVRDPRDGTVWCQPHYPTTSDDQYRVTARIEEMERAGWVEDNHDGIGITAAGREVLAAYQKEVDGG